MTENGTLLRTKSASFGGWILFLLETFFLSVGNQKKKIHNFLIQLPMAGLKIEFCNLYFDRVHHAATCLEWVQKAPLYVRHSTDCTCCDFGHLRFFILLHTP
jgi:hypothetical protein